MAEVVESNGLGEFGFQLVASRTACLVDEKEYRLPDDLSLVEAFLQVPPFEHALEALIHIVVGRNYVSEHVTHQSSEFPGAEASCITHNYEFSPS